MYVWSAADGLDSSYVPTSKIQAHSTYITKCQFSPNSEYLATASADHTVGLWQFPSSTLPIPSKGADSMASSSLGTDQWSQLSNEERDSDEISVTSSDVEPDSMVLRHSYEGHLKWVWDCAFSADSAYLVSASSDNTARLWSISSGECICIYTGHTKALTSVALNDLAL